MTYEEMLQTKVAFGTGERLIDRFAELREELGLDGIVSELNAGGLIPEEGTRGGRTLVRPLSFGKEDPAMRIAVLDDYQSVAESLADWSQLPTGTQVEFFSGHLTSEDALASRLADFDVVMGMRERTPFPRALLERLPRLRLLVTTGRRNASFDIDAATDLGIAVCGTDGAGEGPAELTWGLILGIVRQIPLEDRLSREGKWGTTVGVGLKGKTIGLLGLGHIGSLVARVANAFDMNVIAWSQNLTAARATECGATLGGKGRALSGFRHLVRPPCAQGPIVNEVALVDALHRRAIAGAALDTFDVEPLPENHPLLQLDNTLICPHLGYVTDDSYRAMYAGVIEDIRAFASGEPVRVINEPVLNTTQFRGFQ
ncbi:D-3-phosphoglycerate dehydrogenase [Geodia barretti]|uniref:D-3-phosphoglycerate dehydrogenase n=1 Tax=Geodia barretti TaxID=519541 RepID=A0AA35XDL9_GEOBA|nr:D-3-phosphoglycerate dehydrogenase [Geodia barretti]